MNPPIHFAEAHEAGVRILTPGASRLRAFIAYDPDYDGHDVAGALARADAATHPRTPAAAPLPPPDWAPPLQKALEARFDHLSFLHDQYCHHQAEFLAGNFSKPADDLNLHLRYCLLLPVPRLNPEWVALTLKETRIRKTQPRNTPALLGPINPDHMTTEAQATTRVKKA